MTITHHPPETMLAAFAAGTLDLGQHSAIATHLVACSACRAFARSAEAVGGQILSALAPAAMSQGALAAAQARLDEAPAEARPVMPPAQAAEIPGLPPFLRRYRFGRWIWVGPGVHVRRIALPFHSDTRVFLLRSAPGTKMLEHTHSGFEMTCVLAGAFQQGGARLGPGDFDYGDKDHVHEPVVEPGRDCICLVAMQGELLLNGLVGRLMQPFIRL